MRPFLFFIWHPIVSACFYFVLCVFLTPSFEGLFSTPDVLSKALPVHSSANFPLVLCTWLDPSSVKTLPKPFSSP